MQISRSDDMATITTSTRPESQNHLMLLRSGGVVLKSRFKETRPEYADCFGDVSFHKATLIGHLTGWRITGSLANTAAKILDTLSKLIAENRADLLRCRPKSAHCTFHEPSYSLQGLLLGTDKTHASPHVAVVTAVEWLSKGLRNIITKSKILAGHPDWACVRLPFTVTPTSPATLRQMDPEPVADKWLEGIYQSEVYVLGRNVPKYLSGTAIEIWRDGSYINKATVGGMLSVGGQSYGLTVAHAFYPHQASDMEFFDMDESEFGFLEPDETVSEEIGITCRDNDGSMNTSIWCSSESPQAESLPGSSEGSSSPGPGSRTEEKILIGHLSIISTAIPDTGAQLDWALIKISHSDISETNAQLPELLERHSSLTQNHVDIFKRSGQVGATVVSKAIFGLPILNEPQAVLVIDTGSTQLGDSGSWTYCASDRKPLGVLVGKSSWPIQESYILTMSDIMTNIKDRTGMNVEVSIHANIVLQDQLVSPGNRGGGINRGTYLEQEAVDRGTLLCPTTEQDHEVSPGVLHVESINVEDGETTLDGVLREDHEIPIQLFSYSKKLENSDSDSSRYSDPGNDSRSDQGSQTPPHHAFKAKDLETRRNDIRALQDALEKAKKDAAHYKKKAYRIDAELIQTRKDLREKEAQWRGLFERSEQFEDENKKLVLEKRELLKITQNLSLDVEELRINLAHAIQAYPEHYTSQKMTPRPEPEIQLNSGGRGKVDLEEKRLPERFERGKEGGIPNDDAESA